ncbi:MAG: DUF1573 domain-containing protein [Desulfomonilaceae bacterium]
MRIATTAILAILLAVAPLVRAETGPVVDFDNESHDYGRVMYGDTVTHEFTLTNTGDQTLTIEKLESSCGCTKAVKGASQVPPHEKTHILASFDTSGLRAGKKQKKVFVHSNDPKRPVVALTLSADVVRELNLDPPSVARKLPSAVETLSFPVKVSNSSDKAVTIKGAAASAGSLQAVLDPENIVVGPRSTTPFTLILKLKNEPNQYYWMGKVSLETDHPREKKLEMRYLIQLNPD